MSGLAATGIGASGHKKSQLMLTGALRRRGLRGRQPPSKVGATGAQKKSAEADFF